MGAKRVAARRGGETRYKAELLRKLEEAGGEVKRGEAGTQKLHT